jgi:hypothetical protein
MPALLGELFATIACVPTFVLSERLERGICLAHSLRVLLIWHVRLDHLWRPPVLEPFALQRCLEGHGVPPPLETEDRVRGTAASPSASLEPHKHSESDVAHPCLRRRCYFDRLRAGLSDRKAQKHPDRGRERDCE